MEFVPASAGSVLAFRVIVAAVGGAFFWAVLRVYGRGRVAVIVISVVWAWVGALTLLVASGRMNTLPFHGLPIFFGSILVICTAAALSPFGKRLAMGLPLAALVGFQAFRLPLELVLHEWAAQGTIPGTMTWTGQNWDIISGVTALICAPLVSRYRTAARIANVVGFALLLNVMRVAIMSSPLPFAWGQRPPLLLALQYPYFLIGPVCVGGALFGHLVLLRALWRQPR
ncbi:MAG TPA: hypothetical protein VG734_00545 [Lacunisphaera sp.]|nr:hypothetical protein [Lacunisphaera sp.]